MFVTSKQGRSVLIADAFDGALVVDRGWEHPVKVYFRREGNTELKLNTEYWVSETTDGEESLLNTALEQNYSLDEGKVKVTDQGSAVPRFLAGETV